LKAFGIIYSQVFLKQQQFTTQWPKYLDRYCSVEAGVDMRVGQP